MRPGRPAAAAVATAVSLCLFAAACTGSSKNRLIPPPPSTVALATTAPGGGEDFSGVALAPVEGRLPVEEVEILGGEATLTGLVTGPDGPVAGATVRLERFVGDAMARLDVVSGGDGIWRAPQPAGPQTVPATAPLQPGQAPPPPTAAPPPPATASPAGPQGIFGGRYRIRAWRTPDLALTTPQILFVESKQNRNLGIQLSRYGGVSASSVNSPDPPILDGVVNVTAVVTTVSVDRDGIVRSVPLAGASVSLMAGSGWEFDGASAITNGQGRAAFLLRCIAVGQSPLELTVNNLERFTLPVRACVPPAPTTTTSPSTLPGDPTTTNPSGPTTTRNSTTTT